MASGQDSDRDSKQQRPDDEPIDARLEQWGRRLGHAVAAAAARAREEAEDIWAEAQSLRRGERE